MPQQEIPGQARNDVLLPGVLADGVLIANVPNGKRNRLPVMTESREYQNLYHVIINLIDEPMFFCDAS